MNRRRLLALLGAFAALPNIGRAQPGVPVIGFLNSASPGPFAHLLAAFRNGLHDNGFVEGQNVAIEYRWAEGQYERLPELVADLRARQVGVIVATGGAPAARAAKEGAGDVPFLFIAGSDPVRLGLVDSLSRPGGNGTGVQMFITGLEPKRLELLRELVPGAALMAVLINPANPDAAGQTREVADAAAAVGQRLLILHASTSAEIDAAFVRLAQEKADALLVAGDPYFNSRREQLVALARRQRIPASYELREFAAAGGLMSYGTSLTDAYRQIGVYAGRVLKGEKPADMPVVQSTRFELVINLRAAEAIDLAVPRALLVRADEVIE
jgi:putative ABC transport system substrate-binding protein